MQSVLIRLSVLYAIGRLRGDMVMVPEHFEYSENDPREKTCGDCKHRWVAFHLATGTSFCNLHNYRTQASCFHICDDWLEDDREKVTMTDDMGHAFRMPKMENSGFIKTYSLENHCPTCSYCQKEIDFYYCKKWFEELEGQERTCRMCEVGTFGKCKFYNHIEGEN